MMTAMMAFFLLMWLLGATNADQRKSIADYFKPTSVSNVTMGKLAGSNGILGGRSIIDPDGFPFSTKQTSLLERVTPRSEGGPTENDPSPNSTERSDPSDPAKMSEEQKKAVAEQQDQASFEKLEKEIREKIEQNPRLANLKDQVKFTREKEGRLCDVWPGRHANDAARPAAGQRSGQVAARYAQQAGGARPYRRGAFQQCRGP